MVLGLTELANGMSLVFAFRQTSSPELDGRTIADDLQSVKKVGEQFELLRKC
jgi:hypothetical protein